MKLFFFKTFDLYLKFFRVPFRARWSDKGSVTSLEGGGWCSACPSFSHTHTLSATRSHFFQHMTFLTMHLSSKCLLLNNTFSWSKNLRHVGVIWQADISYVESGVWKSFGAVIVFDTGFFFFLKSESDLNRVWHNDTLLLSSSITMCVKVREKEKERGRERDVWNQQLLKNLKLWTVGVWQSASLCVPG